MGTAFWQSKDPARAYIAALQKSAGIPSTGAWDLPSHQALYALANKFNPEVSAKVAWGAEPAKTAEYVVGIVNDDDMSEETYAALRPLLLELGFPMLSFSDAAAWVENRSPEEEQQIVAALKAVAEAVGTAESQPLPAPAAPPPTNQTVAQGTTPLPPQVQGPAPAAPVAPANGAPAPNGQAASLVAVTTGMSRNGKIALGVGITLAALLIGGLAWKAFKKDEPKTEFVGSRNRKEGFGCDCG
jgi:hypothetical protein